MKGINMNKSINVNTVIAQSLNLTASLYLELKARHTLTDDEAALYHSSLETLNQGMQCGLVTWVNSMPLINMDKLINW